MTGNVKPRASRGRNAEEGVKRCMENVPAETRVHASEAWGQTHAMGHSREGGPGQTPRGRGRSRETGGRCHGAGGTEAVGRGRPSLGRRPVRAP